jgi:hypothetical protein
MFGIKLKLIKCRFALTYFSDLLSGVRGIFTNPKYLFAEVSVENFKWAFLRLSFLCTCG